MSDQPRILLTNDDGVDAPGLALLREIADHFSKDVWVVAPAENQSGAGHRFSLGYELELDRREERVYALNGTPADCVVGGITHLMKDHRPDIVLSGVNRGQNVGDLIHCSGTVAGAREGALQGALGIALSQGMDFSAPHSLNWEATEHHAVEVVETILEAASGTETYFNVNFPRCTPTEVTGVRIVAHQRFSRSPFEFYPSDNAGKHFVAVLDAPHPLDPEADFANLIDNHAITVTPLLLQQTDREAATALERHFAARQGRGAA
ncbi:5'/3'-nucleotidase SurE [Cucumibacter marinus]|uniref:5'/3'-nucleotidase SurE n=1 Tax=Cucumibacter marinus TaxID=1121252 RepID=UPI000425801A|nr:5'/3'-nucleotidase SurE [Cucumibacter marinus]